jgi:hypothetical protein
MATEIGMKRENEHRVLPVCSVELLLIELG